MPTRPLPMPIAETRLARAEQLLQQKRKPKETSADADRLAEQLDRLLIAKWRDVRGKVEPTDQEFLRWLFLDVRGTPPTQVEMNYFEADKDPKKRERLVEWLFAEVRKAPGHGKLVAELLADPDVQKRWAAVWKERLQAEGRVTTQRQFLAQWMRATGDRLDQLLAGLLSGGKSDEQVLDALCLATLARFPTETERKVILDGVKSQPDRKPAWGAVLRALASTQEAKAHAEGLAKRGVK
jgi:hypothetical protein